MEFHPMHDDVMYNFIEGEIIKIKTLKGAINPKLIIRGNCTRFPTLTNIIGHFYWSIHRKTTIRKV
jgi:hypothetical protein